MIRRLQFNDFEFAQQIGAGTVGTIHVVRGRQDGVQYALKLLSPTVSSDALVVSRFEREMLVLSKLNHPHIVGYLGQGRHEGQLFYVMELIQGGTLKSLLEKTGPFTWREAADCGRQLASALQHAHNHGIIHRDLKPGNVFVTLDGQLKLGDFGIARDLRSDELTDVGLTVGTYAYMPPEMVNGERAITGGVDLYALGCVLFEMLTGRTPFVGDNFAQIFEQHLRQPPPRPSVLAADVPIELDQIVIELLAKSPADRPFNARAVQGRLGKLIDERCETEVRDRGAQAVHLDHLTIRDRMLRSGEQPSVGWFAWGLAAAGLVAALMLIRLLAT